MEIKVFYAWQSDKSVSSKVNRNFIEDALKKAVKRIRRDDTVRIEPVIDRDTKGLSGTPHIPQAILDKIGQCHAFVGDITIINRNSKFRLCPNPNVLFELGYAVHSLGWDRVVLVMNEAFGAIRELPFDLEKRRVSAYSLTELSTDKTEQKTRLVDQIELSLRRIIDEIEAELETKAEEVPEELSKKKEKHGKRLAKEHDFVAFRKQWLVSESGQNEVKADSLRLAQAIEEEIAYQFESAEGMGLAFDDRSKDGFLDIVFRYGYKVVYEMKWFQAYRNSVEQCGIRFLKAVNKGNQPSNKAKHYIADLNVEKEITWQEMGKSDIPVSIEILAERFIADFVLDIQSVINAEHEGGSGLV